MPSHDPSDHQTDEQTKPGTEKRTQYVEELRSLEDYPPGDAWFSLNEAAYITRSSPASIWRLIDSGRLPVKREPSGSVPRPWLVRESDVAQIRPILDPTAARQMAFKSPWKEEFDESWSTNPEKHSLMRIVQRFGCSYPDPPGS